MTKSDGDGLDDKDTLGKILHKFWQNSPAAYNTITRQNSDEAKAAINAWALAEFEALLPDKLPTEAHEKWMGKGHLTSLDKGFNLAVDIIHQAAKERFEV